MDLNDISEFLLSAARSVGAEVASPWFYLQLGLILAGCHGHLADPVEGAQFGADGPRAVLAGHASHVIDDSCHRGCPYRHGRVPSAR